MAVTEKQINELDDHFKQLKLPKSIQLDEGSMINDVSKFIDSHLTVLRHNGDRPIYDVFYNRLLHLKELIK